MLCAVNKSRPNAVPMKNVTGPDLKSALFQPEKVDLRSEKIGIERERFELS
jgi:hypothetical protein